MNSKLSVSLLLAIFATGCAQVQQGGRPELFQVQASLVCINQGGYRIAFDLMNTGDVDDRIGQAELPWAPDAIRFNSIQLIDKKTGEMVMPEPPLADSFGFEELPAHKTVSGSLRLGFLFNKDDLLKFINAGNAAIDWDYAAHTEKGQPIRGKGEIPLSGIKDPTACEQQPTPRT